MKNSSLQIAGIVLLIFGVVIWIANTVIFKFILFASMHSPKELELLSTYAYIASTSSYVLILLGFFLILWDMGKRVNAGSTYNTTLIILIILIVVIPSFLGFYWLLYVLKVPQVYPILNVIHTTLFPLGILVVGIALLILASKLMENEISSTTQ